MRKISVPYHLRFFICFYACLLAPIAYERYPCGSLAACISTGAACILAAVFIAIVAHAFVVFVMDVIEAYNETKRKARQLRQETEL